MNDLQYTVYWYDKWTIIKCASFNTLKEAVCKERKLRLERKTILSGKEAMKKEAYTVKNNLDVFI